MDLSNKTLAMILVVTMVLSLGGTLISLNRIDSAGITGRAGSDVGNVTLQVNNTASLRFTVASLDFGSGAVNASGGYYNCTLSSMGVRTAYSCAGFTTVSQGLVIENDGNQNLSVQLNSSDTNLSFIGGTQGGGSRFEWNVTENETQSCKSSMFSANGTWVNVNASPAGTLICRDLQWNQNDTLLVHVYINIPANSNAGQRNATLTATGTLAS
jgi:hypothetical protein